MPSVCNVQHSTVDNSFQADKSNVFENSADPDVLNSNISNYSGDAELQDLKIPKILKEIDDCSLDTSCVVSRTRKRKFPYHGEERQAGNINRNIKEINLSVNNMKEDKTLGTINFDNKENSLVKSPIKKPRKSMKFCKIKLVEYLIESPESQKFEIDSVQTDEMDIKNKRPGILSFKCKKCSEKFDSASQLNTHYYMHDFENQKNDVFQANSENGESCYYPSKIYRELISPENKIVKIDHKLDQFSQEFKNRENLAANISEHHDNKLSISKNEEKHKCPHCNEEFSLLKRLHFHQATSCIKAQDSLIKYLNDNNLGHFGCSICAENFKNQDDVQNHKNLKHPKLKTLARRQLH